MGLMLQSDNTSNQRAQGQSEISAGPEHVELVITAAAASISAAREQSECDEKLCYVCMVRSNLARTSTHIS